VLNQQLLRLGRILSPKRPCNLASERASEHALQAASARDSDVRTAVSLAIATTTVPALLIFVAALRNASNRFHALSRWQRNDADLAKPR